MKGLFTVLLSALILSGCTVRIYDDIGPHPKPHPAPQNHPQPDRGQPDCRDPHQCPQLQPQPQRRM